MTDKVGLIKNPLTIIAIFAGIAEVSGTLVLPFINELNQATFIYFLIFFPSVLILLFFITLNFNNKVLYAPSDYKDETHYLKINKYDIAKQETVEIKVTNEDSQNQRIVELEEKITKLNSQILNYKKSIQTNSEIIEDYTTINDDYYEYFVSDFSNAPSYISLLRRKGISFEIYRSPGSINNSYPNAKDNMSIWLGKDIRLKEAQIIIKYAKKFFPFLKYITLSGKYFNEHDQIFIGGDTNAAVERFNRREINVSEFIKLQEFTELEPFHKYIESFHK